LTELTDEGDSPRIRLHPHRGDDVVDEVILAVPEPTHRFSLRGVIRGALREVDATGGEKVAHAVESGLAIHIEPVIRGDLEGTKGFACVRRALLQVRIKHLFPTRRVYVGGVRDHAVEVEQDGIVCVAGDRILVIELLHRSLLCNCPSPWPPEEEGNEVSLYDCITCAPTTSSLLPYQSAAPFFNEDVVEDNAYGSRPAELCLCSRSYLV